MLNILVFIALGVVISIVSTIAGIGGGVFMVPLFYFLGLGISKAVGTSKFVVVFVSLIGSINYMRSRKVLLKTGLLVLLGMIPFSYLGAYLVGAIDKTILKLLVASFLIFYSIRLLYIYVKAKYFGGKQEARDSRDKLEQTSILRTCLMIAIGAFAGLKAGLTGTGGGAIVMPLFLSVLRIPIHYAVATSTFVIFPSAAIAASRHVLDNTVEYSIAIPFTIGAITGASIGPRIALSMKPMLLRLVIGAVLLIAGVKMLLS